MGERTVDGGGVKETPVERWGDHGQVTSQASAGGAVGPGTESREAADAARRRQAPIHSESQEEPPAAEGSSVEAPLAESRPGRHPAGTGRLLGAIAFGAILGGPARYGLGLALPTAAGTFPATTFVINVVGSVILALLLVFVLEIWPPTTYVRPFAAVGFCGAFTTFSTWMVDSDRLLAHGHYGVAVADVGGALIAGLGGTALGFSVGRSVVARRRVARERLAEFGDEGIAA